jgi:hypothetical protein
MPMPSPPSARLRISRGFGSQFVPIGRKEDGTGK